ncbi:hypothetical protein [Noviherbaspirillum sp.]|uniref:hypothetical protein n=1 Tax=Noviherbaspirillum sp. TaxID=1926288 RepID=UPI002B498EEE|nr:hypothetical protein [Noviherbaspirillum sp.]HJV80555.1 hypothetical protein [Noviherbaspirillum sp.]
MNVNNSNPYTGPSASSGQVNPDTAANQGVERLRKANERMAVIVGHLNAEPGTVPHALGNSSDLASVPAATLTSNAPTAKSTEKSEVGVQDVDNVGPDWPKITAKDLRRGDILFERFIGDKAHLGIWDLQFNSEGLNGFEPNLGDSKVTHAAMVTGNGPNGPEVAQAKGKPEKQVINGPWTPKDGASYYVYRCVADENLTDWAALIFQCWASEGKIPYNYEDRMELVGDARFTPEMTNYFRTLQEQAFDPNPKLFGPDETRNLKMGGLTCGESVVAALAAAKLNIAAAQHANIEGYDPINALEGAEKVNPRSIMPRTLQHLMETDKRFARVGFFTPESEKKPAEAQQLKKSAETE